MRRSGGRLVAVEDKSGASSGGREGIIRGSLDENSVSIRCRVRLGRNMRATTLSEDVSVALARQSSD